MRHLTTATCLALTCAASPGLALEFGNGFSLDGEVVMEVGSDAALAETAGYADLTLGWRSASDTPLGFGVDLTFQGFRADDDFSTTSIEEVWVAGVLTTRFGDLSVGKPQPVLERMFEVPSLAESRVYDEALRFTGTSSRSILFLYSSLDILSPRGVTFRGSAGNLTYGLGVHRLDDTGFGGGSATASEVGGIYRIGPVEVMAGVTRLSPAIESVQAGIRYSAERWSVGYHVVQSELFGVTGSPFESRTLYGDARIGSAFRVGAQAVQVGSQGSLGDAVYGLNGEYGFGNGGFVRLGAILFDDPALDDVTTASVGWRF